MRQRALVGFVMAGLITFGTSRKAAADDLAAWFGAWAIVGTWSVQVTLANCATGAEIPGATFPALNTFIAGGSMLSDPAANPALLRTGHGVWDYAGGRQFTNTVVLFRFNADGSYAGTQTIRRTISVSRDFNEFTARDTATTADPAGNVVATSCGIGRGRRLQS